MISAIMITMIIATVFGVAAIRDIGQKNSEKMLMLLCEAGAKNLDVSLLDVEQDVETISAYVEADLTALDDESLSAHLNRVSDFFKRALYKTNGIITYYYRIDPAVTPNVKGFWFVNESWCGLPSPRQPGNLSGCRRILPIISMHGSSPITHRSI